MNQTAAFLNRDIWERKVFTGTWDAISLPDSIARDPATGHELGKISMATPDAIAKSAAKARKVQPGWFALAYEERAKILRNAAQLAETHQEQIVDWLVRESGSTRAKAAFETAITIKVLYESSGLPSRSLGEILPSVPGKINLARRRPLGVVGVISPFNFPLYLAMRAVAPAIAVGNSVVLKPDSRTAVCGGYAIARLFELAGLPEGVLHVLSGDGEAGAALVADPNVAMIQFTGSTAAGRKVGESAGRHLKKVSLELGGKSSLIVLDDANLDLAAANAAWGSYLHQGQICMASGRILVHRRIYNEFLERLVAKAQNLKVGNPSNEDVMLGPLISDQQLNHVHQIVESAIQAGAKVEIGGSYEGLFYKPTVLSDVGKNNPAYIAEIFGPVAVIVPFDSDDEAINIANDTEYGLSAAIISQDVGRALRVGEQLRTGILHINDQTVNDDVINPFGGVGASGNGTSIGGAANWEEFTQWQWMTIKNEAPAYPF